MTFEEKLYNKKELIGKALFSVSILFLISMFILSLNGIYIFIDERFSLYLIQLPLDKAISLCIMDVHPPLYYIIIKIPCEILSALNIQYNPIIITRLTSMLPYLIILIVSVTKLRKEYGWFIIGFFTFSLAAMSGFFIQFLTIRMYNWGLLFLLMSFIYLKDIIFKKDAKSWILFTLFTLLCGYTQYIMLISSGILYLGLLLHYLINKDYKEIKKWFVSAAAVVLLYLPWILIFLGQLTKETSKKSAVIPSVTNIIDYFSGYALKSQTFDPGIVVLKVIAIFLLLYIIRWALARYLTKRDDCNSYTFIGILTPVLTIISLMIGFIIISRSIDIRYLVPVFSIAWLAISIFLGTWDKKRAFAILLLALLVLGCINTIDNAYNLNKSISKGYTEQSILEDINNENSIVVYTHRFSYTCYSNDLNNTEGYGTDKLSELPYEYDLTSTNLTKADIKPLAKDNPNKHVYWLGKVKNRDKYDVLFNRGDFSIIKIS